MNYSELEYGSKLTAQQDTDIQCGYDFDKRQKVYIMKGGVVEVGAVRKSYFYVRASPEHIAVRLPKSFYNRYFKPA